MSTVEINETVFVQTMCLLRLNQKISLIFLVCSDPKEGLHLINQLQLSYKGDGTGLFKQFILSHLLKFKETFYIVCVESLVLLKQYKLLRSLGFKKSTKDDPAMSGHVHKLRKYLYLLAESLNEAQTRDFILTVSGLNSEKHTQLEKAILQWVVEGLVSLEIDNAESVRKITTKLENYGETARRIKETLCSTPTVDLPIDMDEYYPIIDKQEIGYCIVINQEQFTRNEELLHLLPDEILSPRPGSEVDVESVKDIFKWLGFKVIIHKNVVFRELRSILLDYANSIEDKHSCFVLVIMSHGTEDVIYAADSVPIKVDDIEMAFQARNCQKLIGKPKIFIIQACQGKKLQRVMIDSISMESKDNNSKPTLSPERGDALIAWSTVKGYASFRDRIQGSWFIQELCSELKRSAYFRDLVDIVTRVNHRLRQKSSQGMHMVPSLTASLCKKIKFPVTILD